MADLLIDSSGERPVRPAIVARTIVRLRALAPYLALILILAAALAARTYNLGWDDNTHQHPDERHVTLVANAIDLPSSPGEYFDTDSSSFNPYNREIPSFVYGTLPLFLGKAVAVVLNQDDYDHLVLVGRYLSVLFDAGTVLFVFLLGRRLFGWRPGLIAAGLYAASPLAIQHSHFWVADPFLTFFTTASLYFCARIAQDGKRVDYLLAGLLLGLGVACKLTALAVAPVLALAALAGVWPQIQAWLSDRRANRLDFLFVPALGLSLALLISITAFRVAQPYAFVTPDLAEPTSLFSLNDQWVQDQKEQARLLGGEVSFPPSVQWIGRTSYLYPARQMIEAGMGPAFGVLGWLAVLYGAFLLLRRGDRRQLVLLAFVLVYFGFMGRQFSLYMRYFLPLYPVLAVLAAFLLADVARLVANLAERRRWRGVTLSGRVVLGLLVLAALLPGLAYLHIYSRPITRIEASEWMYDHLPDGSSIAVEHWDDSLPLRLPDSPARTYNLISLGVYDRDTQKKIETLIDQLADSDYLVLTSNRALNSVARNEANNPVMGRYYDLLLDQQMGFDLVATFESPPRLLGIDLPDSQREESWSSYDHPRVLVFQKNGDFSRERLESLLGHGPFSEFSLSPAQAARNGLLLSADDLQTQRQGGSWTDVFSSDGFVANYPTVVWLLAIQVASLAVLPLVLLLFRRLPDRGYLLAKPLGLLLLAYPVWLIVSLQLVHFEQSTILIWLGVLVAGAGVAVAMRGGELGRFLRENWRLVLFCELLFLAAFFLFREIRLLNPDLWHPFRGGEKPMDLAYFTAVTRSTTLPPYDPWFAGGYINYYYFGQFLTATITKLTTIPPEVAYNLAVPTYAALTVAAAFSVAYNLAAMARRTLRRGPGLRRLPRWTLYVAGLLGVFFVAFAGNLDGVGQMAERLSEASSFQVATGSSPFDRLLNSFGGAWQVVFHGAALRDFDFWRPSRMMPPQISITEFPEFSFLFADLHAHMMAIPFEVLAIGVGAALALGRRGERGSPGEWGLVALLALVVGSLRWINSWDYPPFLLIGFASIVIGERYGEGGLPAAGLRVLLKGAALFLLSYLLFLPFSQHYLAPISGLHATPEVTPPHQYLAHFGVFVAIVGVWMLYVTARAWRASPLARMSLMFRNTPRGIAVPRSVAQGQLWLSFLVGIGGAMLIFAIGLWVNGHELIALLLPALLLLAYLAVREFRLRRPDGGLRLFVYTLIGLGLGLSIGVDLVTLNDDIQRMNTVFKFYLHTWVVFALSASFAAWYLLSVFWRPERFSSIARTLAPVAGSAALVLLIGAALIYPVAATPVRVDDRFADLPPTLDGTAYMQTAVYDDEHGPIDLSYDYQGIRWLRENVQGTPAIVEGRTDLYRWGSRFSIYTGLPTVIGWDWHQTQQRGEMSFLVRQRLDEVVRFYVDPDVPQAVDFLQRYDVHYVIVGQVERLYYPETGLEKFAAGLNGALEVAYENPELTIYRVVNTEAETALSP